MQPSGEKSRGGAESTLLIGLALWLIVMVWSYFRPSLWILDLLVLPTMAILAVVGTVMVVLGAVRTGRHSRKAAAAMGALVAAVAVLTVTIGSWFYLSPKAWFTTHRVLYEKALKADPGDDYYGASLPFYLSFLTSTGNVSGRGDVRFFPQWLGIPDDAGGYLHSPSGPPGGFDMYGQLCSEPVRLGGDWYMCGMRD